MALYRIQRQWPPLSQEELDAAAFRAVTCLPRFPDLKWQRSYYDTATNRSTCCYEAEGPENIRWHAELARVPCDEIAAVVEYLPERYQ